MQNSCNPAFPGRQVRLASTAKPITPITPIGGLVSLIACFERIFERIGLAGQISALIARRHGRPEESLRSKIFTQPSHKKA